MMKPRSLELVSLDPKEFPCIWWFDGNCSTPSSYSYFSTICFLTSLFMMNIFV
jgi:hypothetical protein